MKGIQPVQIVSERHTIREQKGHCNQVLLVIKSYYCIKNLKIILHEQRKHSFLYVTGVCLGSYFQSLLQVPLLLVRVHDTM